MPNDRVFLTGATGFIGAHVARALLESGYRVRALVRDGAARVDGCEIVVGDVRRAGELVSALRDCRYVVHCAALYSFAPRARVAIHETNVVGTIGLLEAARIAGVERGVVTSSSAAVGPSRNGVPATEQQWALDGRGSAYHHSKVRQERAALSARVPVVTVLPTAPVGPGDRKPTPTGKMVLDFARGKMPFLPPSGGINLVAVEDVARAHVTALERGRPGERYLIGGENLLLVDVWRLLAKVTGRRMPTRRLPYAFAVAAGYADAVRCSIFPRAIPAVPLEGVRMARELMFVDSAKATAELRFQASPVVDALERAYIWYRDNGYLS